MSFKSGFYQFQVTLTSKRLVELPGTAAFAYPDQLRAHIQELTRGFTIFEEEGVVVTYSANAIFKVEAFLCKPYED